MIDTKQAALCFVTSKQGGTEIEEVAESNPDAICKIFVKDKLDNDEIISLAKQLDLKDNLIDEFVDLLNNMYNLFISKDCSLIEINPLVISNNHLLCLDAKMSFDDGALFRHPDIESLKDPEEENILELTASEHGMSYVSLGGDIGCICNGAGLGMSTMDTINYCNGKAANFLDLGGSVDAERANLAFKLVIQEKGVKGVLINIFGGIARTNLIAEGVCKAIEETGYDKPVVARIEGNGDMIANEIIDNCKGNIYRENSCYRACLKMIELIKEGN